jgi:hypothetical protein
MLMTDVPIYEKKNLADNVAIYVRGRELFRPPTYLGYAINAFFQSISDSTLIIYSVIDA